MKTRHLVLIISLIVPMIFSPLEASTKKCQTSLSGRDPNEMVQLFDGDQAVDMFMCDSCQGWRRVKIEKNGKRECEGCGNPFGATDKVMRPYYESRDGQTWTQRKFLPLSEREAALFANSGPDWACGNCSAHTRNWGYDKNCSGCGAPRENALANFDPHQDIAYQDPETPKPPPPPPPNIKRGSRASSKNTRSRPTADFSLPRADMSQISFTKNNKIILSTALVGFLGMSGIVGGFYHHTHPGPLVGSVSEITKEIVLFKDRETYERYKKVTLDLAHPPEGVKVLLEKDVKGEIVSEPTVNVEGPQMRRMIYASVEVNGRLLHISIPVEQEQDWKKGDKVTVAFTSPSDYEIQKQNKK